MAQRIYEGEAREFVVIRSMNLVDCRRDEMGYFRWCSKTLTNMIIDVAGFG